MMGFSIIAKEAGFDIWMVMLTTASVWGMPGHEWAWIIAGVCVVFAVGLSMRTLSLHLHSRAQPVLSLYYIRVVLMVPIYSVEAFLGLVCRNYSLIFEFLRDWYEAFVNARLTW